ncbi:hypothetical protein AU385_08170 [Bacillus halotolerans]|nr:hypothetical protein AU385_08170 [Bacillus halotolerans]PHI49322.1 hypothetical protein B9T64_04660 [Bacillus halotolerans]PSA98335.1 hypothetical protein C6372_10705 [Bacillus halotolerans]
MDKLQEIISDLSLWQLASEEELQPCDINAGPCYIIEKRYVKEIMIGFMKKQKAIIEENKRQQEIMVHQFRQAQADDLKMVGKDAIIAKRDKTNGWLIGAIAVVLFLTIAVLPGVIGSN